MVVGHSEWLADGAVLEEAERLPLNPWAPGSRDYFVFVRCGRALPRRESSG
jgi:hypothetical protein